MEQIVSEVVYLLDSLAKKQNVRLKFDSPPVASLVQLAEGEVKQILYNLMRNALQASPPGEEVTIGITLDRQEIAVHVKDQGPGIPTDIQPLIFDPFFSTKQGASQSGMGLGLSVSRSLIESMGGRIDVESEVNKGSRFSAIFPRRLDAATEEDRDG